MKRPYLIKAIFLLSFIFLLQCSKDNPNPTGQNGLSAEALAYLTDHLQPLQPATLTGFDNWDAETLQPYQFIFTGESHGMINNYDMDLAMVKHLNAIGWLDYYSPEMPYSFCWFINRFLEEGEGEMLDKLIQPFRGTLGWTKENRQHFLNLFDYNQSLPEDQQIKLVGIEVEHVPENPLWMMNELIPQADFPIEIAPNLEALQMLHQSGSISYSDLYAISSKIEVDFVDHEQLYQDFFQHNWPDFEHIILLTNHTYEAKQLPRENNRFFEERENIIFNSFLKFQKELPAGNWYGQWGSRHIFRHPINELQSIAFKLNKKEQSPIPGKVLSILYVYQNSSHLNNNPYRVQQIDSSPFKKEFDLLSLGLYTLFPLKAENSPFEKELIWPIQSSTPTDGVTTDYFQYLLLVDGAEAASPLE